MLDVLFGGRKASLYVAWTFFVESYGSVFRIHDTMMRVRILGSVPGYSGLRIWIRLRILLFLAVSLKMPTKN